MNSTATRHSSRVAARASVLLAIFSSAAFAHARSETYSDWQINGSTVHLSFTIPDAEAKRLAPPGSAMPNSDRLGDYVAAHVGVNSGGNPCKRQSGPDAVMALPGVQRFEANFECPAAAMLQVHSSAFFDLVPTHTNLAQIQTADGNFIEQLITRDRQTLDVSATGQSPLQNAGFLEYVRMGVLHIFTGLDHQAFLIGLVLLSPRLRDLVFVITGFTLGHSATLALAVTGILRPHAEFIDALIGLTIALVGAECLSANSRRPGAVALSIGSLLLTMALGSWCGVKGLPATLLIGSGLFGMSYIFIAGHLRDAARFRLLVTIVFGLIHGFGFAANLLEMKLPTNRLAELLVGFNIGVELGQVTLVAGVVLLISGVKRLWHAPPTRLATDFATALLIGVGLFWFVGRGYA